MPELLKERYFNNQFIEKLASIINDIHPAFNGSRFKTLVFDPSWQEKELKEKMRHITLSLGETLPADYSSALSILKKAAPAFNDFDAMLFPDYVEVFGLENWELSLEALVYFTKYSSSEFAIRPFILREAEDVMRRMREWAKDENYHVRRFASEGCRPRLPWAFALPEFKKDPQPILPILEELKSDESEYVRRSVANNLNDISKEHPELVLQICEKWYGNNERTDWIVRHACRGLLKSGNQRALALFGFGKPTHVKVDNLSLNKRRLAISEELHFSFDMRSSHGALNNLRLEYVIYFRKANGKSNGKVFKIAEGNYDKQTIRFSRKHSFKNLTTRKHYPGTHKMSIIVNGDEKEIAHFELTN